ncbi:MAG: hypothetical protein Q9196_004702 [Gyalolechia fulgens]
MVPREYDITPNSKNIKNAKERTHGLSEDMDIIVLVSKLIYRPKWYGDGEDDSEGKALIWQGRNDLWADLIPRPPDALPNTDLAAAMDQLGLPTRPKPDFSFGYGDDAFPGGLKARIDSLPADLLVFPKKPWFPYKVVQWKSASGTVREAEQQIRRDTSTASDTIYRFFKRAHPTQEPLPENVCLRDGSLTLVLSPPRTNLAQTVAPHTSNTQNIAQQDPVQAHRLQGTIPHTPPHSSPGSPQSRGSRSRPGKRQRVACDNSSESDDVDPLG